MASENCSPREAGDGIGIKVPLTSYNDLLAAGRILAKEGRYIMMVGSQEPGAWLEMFQQAGGHIFDASGELTLHDPRADQIFEFLVKGTKDQALLGAARLVHGPGHRGTQAPLGARMNSSVSNYWTAYVGGRSYHKCYGLRK